ncbi:hypothetical protein H696_05101 [Fonticula alba]|uniref:Uncharacterized protein n=1 Tax=Fonticula alba TaxID=691883 RepID=A0A058Z3S2_FONAL|nr:hypothetical protein H696_05101 [Fonticula alba]KCV68172.1 hypothetical protein H696_05101 [Fonticula alba]|eukprot:XP_009497226.1 hypothetical protein H696_05101 [Fonticula alba]
MSSPHLNPDGTASNVKVSANIAKLAAKISFPLGVPGAKPYPKSPDSEFPPSPEAERLPTPTTLRTVTFDAPPKTSSLDNSALRRKAAVRPTGRRAQSMMVLAPTDISQFGPSNTEVLPVAAPRPLSMAVVPEPAVAESPAAPAAVVTPPPEPTVIATPAAAPAPEPVAAAAAPPKPVVADTPKQPAVEPAPPASATPAATSTPGLEEGQASMSDCPPQPAMEVFPAPVAAQPADGKPADGKPTDGKPSGALLVPDTSAPAAPPAEEGILGAMVSAISSVVGFIWTSLFGGDSP